MCVMIIKLFNFEAEKLKKRITPSTFADGVKIKSFKNPSFMPQSRPIVEQPYYSVNKKPEFNKNSGIDNHLLWLSCH